MDLAIAHKGIQITTTRISGTPAHSSCPHLGASAINVAAEMIGQIADIMPEQQDDRFTPPASTWNVGKIRGGSAVNIISELCEFEWECRPLPGTDFAAFDQSLAALSGRLQERQSGIRIDNRTEASVPGLPAGKNSEAAKFLKTLLPGASLTTAPFVTEAGLYQQAGIPTVVCGPGLLQQAHQPDEHVSLAMLQRCHEFLLALVQTLTSPR